MTRFPLDFIVARLVAPSSRTFAWDFAIDLRPQTRVLVGVGDQLRPCRLQYRLAGEMLDPEG